MEGNIAEIRVMMGRVVSGIGKPDGEKESGKNGVTAEVVNGAKKGRPKEKAKGGRARSSSRRRGRSRGRRAA